MPLSPTEISERFEERARVCGEFGPVIEHLVRQLIDAAQLRVHSVTYRVKSHDSFVRKLNKEGRSYGSINDIHDLLGIRVITYFPDEVDEIAEVVEREFKIDPENSVDKRAALDPDRFGYLSLHYVAEMSAPRVDLTEHAKFRGLKFEVQIRSILQHAWAEIEHDLGYHSQAAIPASVRRRFFRLAGLLEIADTEFEALRDDVGRYSQAVEQVVATPNDLPVDRETMFAFAKSSDLVHELDRVFQDMFPEAPATPLQLSYAAALAEEFNNLGVRHLGEVADKLAENVDLLKRFAEIWFRDVGMGEIPEAISLFYLTWVLAGSLDDQNAIETYIEKSNFGGSASELAARVKRIYTEASSCSD